MAPQGRLAVAAALAVLLSSLPAGAQSPASAPGAGSALIPVPLVSAMPAPLGTPAKAPSASLTAQLPLTGDEPIAWSPEIQLVPWDGVGLELVACIEDADVEELQVVGQLTLGRFDGGYAHGVLVGVGYEPDSGNGAAGLFYLPGYRFDEVFSVQAVVGAATSVGHDRGQETAASANVSGFAVVSPSFTLSLEAVYEIPTRGGDGDDWELLVMPEVLWQRGRWSVGVGLGPLFTRSRTDAVALASLTVGF